MWLLEIFLIPWFPSPEICVKYPAPRCEVSSVSLLSIACCFGVCFRNTQAMGQEQSCTDLRRPKAAHCSVLTKLEHISSSFETVDLKSAWYVLKTWTDGFKSRLQENNASCYVVTAVGASGSGSITVTCRIPTPKIPSLTAWEVALAVADDMNLKILGDNW